MIRQFYDPGHGGFWQTVANPAELILRMKEDYDGAEPAVHPFARALPAGSGHPQAYPCVGTACQLPTSDPQALQQWLLGQTSLTSGKKSIIMSLDRERKRGK